VPGQLQDSVKAVLPGIDDRQLASKFGLIRQLAPRNSDAELAHFDDPALHL
jgi:hypothetical protein